MEDFAEIMKQEGWEFNPDTNVAYLAWQYWDRGEKLSKASLEETDLEAAQELSRMAADYRLLSEVVLAERNMKQL